MVFYHLFDCYVPRAKVFNHILYTQRLLKLLFYMLLGISSSQLDIGLGGWE